MLAPKANFTYRQAEQLFLPELKPPELYISVLANIQFKWTEQPDS